MSYDHLRTGSPQRDDPFQDSQYDSRAPSPGQHPAYAQQRSNLVPPPHLQMPAASNERLAMQPTYSVENIPSTYGHNDQYNEQHPLRNSYNAHDYAVSPEEHHNAYYNQPYSPHPQGDYALEQYPQQGQYHTDSDNIPILQHNNSYGPNAQDLGDDYHDDPNEEIPAMAGPGIRRWKTVKEVQLVDGNLVLDCPVPPRLLRQVPHGARDEFTHMRYTAATCDPKDFYEERFTLRQRLFAKPRQTELFIVVTMYNEDEFLFARTMIGVFKNIEYMCNRTSSKTWGKEAWKKIVVCVVSDGRAKINERTKAVLAGLGIYQDGIAKQQVNGKDVTAHIYEYTTQVGLELKGTQVSVTPKGKTPVQMLFCLKEKNQKKINSHRWFFQAFGRCLDPNICVLIDAGTKPGKDSIYQLWKAFELNPMCGGACGEIKVMLEHGKKLYNPLVATQNFEYKMSNILDKPFESAFGFISVLPGAFSAYRYVALQNDKNGEGPLEKYFKGETMHADAGVFTSNMYLAEDRILCFELVSKRNCAWVLSYVKSATGETDVPDGIAEFVLQRRRWLNGSFFAAIYAIVHFYQIWRSDHSAIRKFMFLIEFIYQTINMTFAWFAIGNFFLVFRLLTGALGTPQTLGTAGIVLGAVFEWIYLATLLYCFVLSLGNRPQGSKKSYLFMVIFWSILMVWLTFASIFLTVRTIQEEAKKPGFGFSTVFTNISFLGVIVSLASTYVLWFVASFLFFDPWHMFTCFVQYIVLTPTYINVLNIYAFCNTHDITWGTKGDDKPEKLPTVTVKHDGKVDVEIPQDDGDLDAQYEAELVKFATKPVKENKPPSPAQRSEDYYKSFRSGVVCVWMMTNFALAAIVLNSVGFDRLQNVNKNPNDLNQPDPNEVLEKNTKIYLLVVLWSVAGLSLCRFIGAIWFLVVRLFRGV